ncbi:hypothetical protein EMIT053CA3_10016 [Pseudomonas donghuensis]
MWSVSFWRATFRWWRISWRGMIFRNLPEHIDRTVDARESGVIEEFRQPGERFSVAPTFMHMAQLNSASQACQPYKVVPGSQKLKLSFCRHVCNGRDCLDHSAPPVFSEYWAARVIAPATSAKNARLRISLR